MFEYLFLLLCSLTLIVRSKVVDDFKECDSFFYEKTPPTGFNDAARYKKICQTDNGVVYYVTLYDTKNKIPTYSAYSVSKQPHSKCNPESRSWKIEPQLSGLKNEPADMQTAGFKKKIYEKSQAIDLDYVGSGYHKGHLNPCNHQSTMAFQSTNTLTNAVPQVANFNQGLWKSTENILLDIMGNYCKLTNFVIVGAVPSTPPDDNWIPSKTKKRVNIPKMMWTAACCKSDKNPFAFGYILENKYNPPSPTVLTIDNLQNTLKTLYQLKELRLFHDRCAQKNDMSDDFIRKVKERISLYEESKLKRSSSKKCPVQQPAKRSKVIARP